MSSMLTDGTYHSSMIAHAPKTPAPPTCDTCFRVARWFPVVFISLIVLWSYYAYVISLCFGYITSSSIVTIVIYLIFYHIAFAMFAFVYYRVIFSDAAGVPVEFFPNDTVMERYLAEDNLMERRKILFDFARSLPVTQRNVDGTIRFCHKCQCCKPDRAHHCSVIGKCVLKMDHFCPWVNNTLGYSNYKLFMLFLFYAIVYCLYVAATAAPYFVQIWTTKLGDDVSSLIKFNVLFVFFVALMFSLSVLALFSYHIYLTLTNQTTVESFHPPYFPSGPDRRGYRMSYRENWRQVFGQNPKLWFLPICTSTVDGIVFPSRSRAQPSDIECPNGNVRDDRLQQSNEQLVPISNGHPSGVYGSAQE